MFECTASQYMTSAVETVTRQVTMLELETLFERHDFNAFPVVEGGKMLGIVTKLDFLRAFAFPQLSGHRGKSSIGGYDFPGKCHARSQGDNTGSPINPTTFGRDGLRRLPA